MRVSIVGSGYVGTTVATCFAAAGHDVTAIDIDNAIVDTINAGQPPVHEPGLTSLLESVAGDSLTATTTYSSVQSSDVIMLALPTPSRPDGSIDLTMVRAGAASVGEAIRDNGDRHIIAVKSTVVPGSTDGLITDALLEGLGQPSIPDRIGIAVNPEFLREGSAVHDFHSPDKIVFGTAPDDGWVRTLLEGLYDPVHEGDGPPIVQTGLREAEMIKYANNAFLASKISLMNDIGNICKQYDIDAYEVAHAIGLDDRIGDRFLRSGVGWGGSCFGKDLAALIAAAHAHGYHPPMLSAAVTVNDQQPERMIELLDRHINPAEKRIAVLGLAFKPGTDDIRDSRSIPIIEALLDRGAAVVAYDPVATANMREQFPSIDYVDSAAAALSNANGALIVTGWDEFSALDDEFETMATPIVIDGRRIVDPPAFVTYEGVTW